MSEKTYIIYFEIFGKKMKTTIDANSQKEAKQKVKDKIIFHKIDGVNEGVDEGVKNENIKQFDIDGLKDFLGMK